MNVFSETDRVIIRNTGDPLLDRKKATVLAKSDAFDTGGMPDHYIVLFDEPYKGVRAMNITKHCLSAI